MAQGVGWRYPDLARILGKKGTLVVVCSRAKAVRGHSTPAGLGLGVLWLYLGLRLCVMYFRADRAAGGT